MTGTGTVHDRRHRLAGEVGAAGLHALAVGVVAAVCATGLLVGAVDVSLAAARARTAADAAALAGMAASPLVTVAGVPGAAGWVATAGDPDAAAGRVAAANGAVMLTSERKGWPLRYAVTVAVEPSTAAVRRVVERVSATAAAAARPPLTVGGARGGPG